MKESFFILENIDNKSQEIYIDLKYLIKNIDFYPLSSALLIIDLQKYFISEESHAYIPSVHAILPRIEELIDLYLQNNLTVILTQHINDEYNAGMMKKWWKELIYEDNVLSIIYPGIVRDNNIIIKKSQYDAFYQTRLDNILKSKGIKQIVIGGVMTHLCCDTTARSAFVHGYEVFFLIDGTASYTEQQHVSAIKNLSHGFVIPVLCHHIKSKIINEKNLKK